MPPDTPSPLLGHCEHTLQELHDAVKDVLGTLGYYIGPNARTAVSRERVDQYWRIAHAMARARGETCPTCKDTGIDSRYSTYGPTPCLLRHLAGHEHVDVPQEALDYMAERRARSASKEAAVDA